MEFCDSYYILVLDGVSKATNFELKLVFLGTMDVKTIGPNWMFGGEFGGECTGLTAFNEDFAFLDEGMGTLMRSFSADLSLMYRVISEIILMKIKFMT